jgi:hypothetical protein
MEHYVYLYRDLKRNPRYVGYGKSSKRAIKHLSLSHNDDLNEFLKNGQFTLEIAGPFDTEQNARSVETALISALRPDCNIDPGQGRWRFRPLGIDEKFSDRLSLKPLLREDFQKLKPKKKRAFIFVKISDKDFDNGDEIRNGYNPAHPPSDAQILKRMVKWWQLGKHVKAWANDETDSPDVLIAVNGTPGAQIIVGSVFIDKASWSKSRYENGLYAIPTCKTLGLDALQLRGRRIDKKANIKFGAFKHQIFMVLNSDGTTIGGNPLR